MNSITLIKSYENMMMRTYDVTSERYHVAVVFINGKRVSNF
jgi:hypothetical protein